MHGVQGVGLVVVPSLVVPDVQGDRRVEGGEEVLGGCGHRNHRVGELRGEKRLKKKGFSKAEGLYNKAA